MVRSADALIRAKVLPAFIVRMRASALLPVRGLNRYFGLLEGGLVCKLSTSQPSNQTGPEIN
jgi:hypothetical protein